MSHAMLLQMDLCPDLLIYPLRDVLRKTFPYIHTYDVWVQTELGTVPDVPLPAGHQLIQ